MIRYLGEKPVNWPAYALVCGWMVLATPLFLFNDAVFSQFPKALELAPLVWWPDLDFLGFALVMSPLAYGAVALLLMPNVDWSPKIGAGLVALGLISFAGGIIWTLDSGVAIYPDRIVYREPGIGQPLNVERFTDIARVEVACSLARPARRRSGVSPEPTFNLIFASGYRVDIWSTPAFGRDRELDARLERVRLIDSQATAVNAVRGPLRRPDGRLVGYPGCVPRLEERYGVGTGALADLFRVRQSELKAGEYEVAAR